MAPFSGFNSTSAAHHSRESRQGHIIVVQVVLLVVALVVYGLRVYTRKCIVRAFGVDDLIMGFAVILMVGLSVNASIGTRFGWGLHGKDIPEDMRKHVVQTAYNAQIIYTMTVSLIKISMLVFYLRLANTKTYRRIIFGSIGFVIAWLVSFTITVVFQCYPIKSYWDPLSVPHYHCVNTNVAMGIHGITNIFTDLFVFILPMPMLWGVQLPRRQRLSLIALFGLGGLVCVGCALRLYYSIVVNNDHEDGTWVGLYLWTFESVEIDLGIVCASAPALKPLIALYFPRFLSTTTANNSHPSSFSFSGRTPLRKNWRFGRVGEVDEIPKPPKLVYKMGPESGYYSESGVSVDERMGVYPLRSGSVEGGDVGTKGTGGWRMASGGRGRRVVESEESLTPSGLREISVRTKIECR